MSAKLSVVVPVYNEADNLAPLHAELTQTLGKSGRAYEILYVDDGSSDGSTTILKELQESDSHVGFLRFSRNYGQTAALVAGFDNASGDVIVALDGDGQNDPADIPRMVARLDEGYDVVVGWRTPREDSWLSRQLPSNMANWLIGRITGVRLHDYGCTLKVMRREVVTGLRLYGEMHRFIPALASDLGARIVEMPVHHRPRRAGVSKYGLSRTIRVILDLITVKFLSSYSTRPIQVFGVFGLISTVAGLAITGFLGFQRIFLGTELADRPLVLLGILLTLMGFQFITMGLLGELLVRTYHESQGKTVYRLAEARGLRPRELKTASEQAVARNLA